MCAVIVEAFNSKSLIRKAVSQVVSGGNELVSAEPLEFVGFVVFVIIQFSTSVALLPRLISQVCCWLLVLHQEHILASPTGREVSNCLSFKINNLLP